MARKLLWPAKEIGPYTFLRGANTFASPHQLPFGAHVTMENVALEQEGSASKRYGYTTYGAVVGTDALLGTAELIRNDGTKYLMKVSNQGKLYSHPSTVIPIRMATPYDVDATNGVSGAVGANLAGTTLYQYAFVAVDATGKTLGSHTIDADSGQVTTGATPYPIAVTGKGVYGAATYEIYRRTFSGTWGAWGVMSTGITHATASGETTVSYSDDGNTAPDTGTNVPSSNTSEYTLPTTTKVDFVVARSSANNVLFGANGAGIFHTNGTTAQLIQPGTTTIGGDPITSNRLWDVTNSIYKVKGLHYHHRCLFLCDASDTPQTFYWSDVDDPTYINPDARINVPDPAGGRVLDFITKDDTLVVGLNTSVYALFGRLFEPSAPGTTVYFGRISEIGVASEWSMRNGPSGMVLYHGADKQPHFLAVISPVKEQVVEGKLCEAIYPTIRTYSDHANAFSLYDGNIYYIAFPSDKKVLKVHFFETPAGQIRAPVIDTMPDGLDYLTRRVDGTLLGADDNTGQLWELYKSGQLTDNNTAISMDITTGSLSGGLDSYPKKAHRLLVVHKTGDTYTVTLTPTIGDTSLDAQTLSITGDAVYDTSTYDNASYSRTGAKTSEFPLKGKGHFFKLSFTNSTTTERPTLFGFFFELTPHRRAKGE